MAWWNRNRGGVRRYTASLTRPSGGGITAAATRYDLTSDTDVAKLAKQQEQWQADAWTWVDIVGELKYAERFVANSFRRIQMFAAFQREEKGEPIAVGEAVRPTDADADLPSGESIAETPDEEFLDARWAREAEDIMRSFQARDGGQAALMERYGVNIWLVGEAVLVNRKVPARRVVADAVPGEPVDVPETVLDWEVRSTDEIRKDPEGKREGWSGLMVVDAPDQQRGTPIEADAFVERVYRKHGRWSQWADSNVRAAIPTCEELALLAMVARVSLRARVFAGFLYVPDELDFGAADQPAGEGNGNKVVRFDREIAEAMTAVLRDEADPASVIPLLMRGPAEFADAVKHIEIPRRYGDEERQQYDEAVKRLARTIDLPVEVLLGMADLNHWTAWQVDEATYEAHIEPVVDVCAEGLTYGLLRPMLEDAGCPTEVLNRMVVAADPSALVRRPDRGKTASEGHGLFALSDQAWRDANGFDAMDAPSDDELTRRLAVARSILTAQLSATLLGKAGLLSPEEVQQVIDATSTGGTPTPVDAGDGASDGEGEQGTPNQNQAENDTSAAVSASVRQLAAAHSLALADRVLRERVQTLVDGAAARVMDRAGARLRTRAQRRNDLRVALAAAGDVPNSRVGQVLGTHVVAELAADVDLLGDAFLDLRPQYDQWVADVQAHALDTLAFTAGAALTDRIRRDVEAAQEEDRDAGWAWLLAALVTLAGQQVRAGVDTAGEGEFDPTVTVPPSLVRQALAIAGGEQVEATAAGGLATLAGDPPGGAATGRVIRLAFAETGFPWTGYVWNYGLAPRQRPFEPHQALAGQQFATWQDPVLANEAGQWPGVAYWSPGDHRHCRCDFAPVVGVEASSTGNTPAPPLED